MLAALDKKLIEYLVAVGQENLFFLDPGAGIQFAVDMKLAEMESRTGVSRELLIEVLAADLAGKLELLKTVLNRAESNLQASLAQGGESQKE